MIQLHPSNPFRPTNWRWERARMLVEKKLRKDTSSDVWTNEAYSFQRRLRKCKDDIDRWNVMEAFPAIYAAYLIYSTGQTTERHPMKFSIEARILAGQPKEEIADLIGVDPSSVEYYERLFFNVKEKLKNKDYIFTCVMGPSIYSGLCDRDYDLLWKLFGYIYGPVALDAFIHGSHNTLRPTRPEEIGSVLASDARDSIQRKVAIVARTYSINPFSQTEILNLYARLLEVEKDTGTNKPQDMIMQNIRIVLDKLPFNIGDDVIKENDRIKLLDNKSAELTAKELLQISEGKIVDTAEIENLRFPESN